MTLERKWKTTMQNHQDNRKNTRMIRRDHILTTTERTVVMLIMVPEGKPFSFAAANVTSVILICYTRNNVTYTPLSSEAEMKTLPEREWRATVQIHQDNQEYTTMIRRGDHIFMMIERTAMMMIMLLESKPCSFMAAKYDLV
jgi:hypothetical protein